MEQSKYDQLSEAYWDVLTLATDDPEYADLSQRLHDMEPRYETILAALSEQDRLFLDRYITLRESVNRRALELACSGILHE